MRIYHLFSSGNHHHVPVMIDFFKNHCVQMDTELQNHVFVKFEEDLLEKNVMLQYKKLGLSSAQILFYPKHIKNVLKCLLSISPKDCIILHGDFIPKFWLLLLTRHQLWERTAWIIWGADISRMKRWFQSLSPKGRLYLAINKIIIPNLGAVCALVPGDYNIVKSIFGSCNNYRRVFYSNHDFSPQNSSYKETIRKPVRVLLGNSAATSNNHIDALQWLAKYKDEDIEVICFLGYGIIENALKRKYLHTVINEGKLLLGNKFYAYIDMYPKDEYLKILDTIDILVYNHRRQQGLFNLYYLISKGKTVYVRRDTSSFLFFKNIGIEIRDSCSIPSMSFPEFATPLTEASIQRNLINFKKHLSLDAAIESWRALFSLLNNK